MGVQKIGDTDLSHTIAGRAGVVAVVKALQVLPGQAGGLAPGTEGGDGGGQQEAGLSLGPGDHGGRVAWRHGYIVRGIYQGGSGKAGLILLDSLPFRSLRVEDMMGKMKNSPDLRPLLEN